MDVEVVSITKGVVTCALEYSSSVTERSRLPCKIKLHFEFTASTSNEEHTLLQEVKQRCLELLKSPIKINVCQDIWTTPDVIRHAKTRSQPRSQHNECTKPQECAERDDDRGSDHQGDVNYEDKTPR